MRAHPLAAEVLGFIVGINKHYANATLMLDGKSTSAASLVQSFQQCGDLAAAATQAEVQRAAAVKAAKEVATQVAPVAAAFKKVVLAAYGGDATILADFGLTPPKKATKTPAVLAAAAEKGKKTRKALGTKGSKQKKDAKKALAAPPAPAQPPEAEAPAQALLLPAKS
ncbi:MAG TPA: hypothetical protein VIF15_14035 [Polyangiaceae bacterium]|jgi:hypothetical protein